MRRIGSMVGALAALGLLAWAPAHAQDDLSDLFDPKNLAFETFRDPAGRFALQFRLDAEGKLALGAFATIAQQGDQEVQLTEAQSFAYDPGTRSVSIAFGRNQAGLREVAGTVASADRDVFQVRRLAARMTFEGGKVEEAELAGSQFRLKGKRDCMVDAFPGANLGILTLKAPFVRERGEWVTVAAEREGWKVLRRRIDYRRAEDEFDVAVAPGREIAALRAAAAVEPLACLSFGVDDTDGADAVRIVDLPRNTLFVEAAGGAMRPLAEVAALFQGPRMSGLAAGVEMEAPSAGEPARVVLAAPGRFFGFLQGADLEHRVSLAVGLGHAPNRTGDIRESLRFIVKAVTRKGRGDAFDPLPIKPGDPGSVFEPLMDWQGRFAEELAAKLGGQLN